MRVASDQVPVITFDRIFEILFGKFCVKKKNEGRGRNPHTGNDLVLGARRVVIFKDILSAPPTPIDTKSSEKYFLFSHK